MRNSHLLRMFATTLRNSNFILNFFFLLFLSLRFSQLRKKAVYKQKFTIPSFVEEVEQSRDGSRCIFFLTGAHKI